ncbi:SCP-like protein [Ancylostoma caninum]|uniref:SCP-like protein n=1 Tax=Ancylostoma caninum TaxID=29170 RepID=A0A368H8I3_ANCCA|nr:SCP-like protein [Ancylostoma caninum]
MGWGIAPPAALMYRMKYSCAAESYAQQQVINCKREPLPAYTYPGYKMNLHVLNNVQTTVAGAIQNAMATWWSQLSQRGIRSDMMFIPPSKCQWSNQNVMSWTKMAWWNNKHLGCAVQKCGGFFLTACMYGPGGNHAHQHVYQVGAVCSQCPKGQCDGEALCRW